MSGDQSPLMKEINVSSWEEYETQIEELHGWRSRRKEQTGLYVNDLVFRGQSNSAWKLLTTLDRYIDRDMSLEEYYKIISVSKPQIETFTDRRWEIPSRSEYIKNICNSGFRGSDIQTPVYEYMAYLRHHGFPSPLLDWTRSPYLAAFFAFNQIVSEVGSVSIYAYVEYAGEAKLTSSDTPWIQLLGPYVRTHRRHFLQQCSYTICKKIANEKIYYARHEEAFSQRLGVQDLLWKINVPMSERLKVLKKLDVMNINAYALFGSEESLMDAMAKREILFR